MDTLACGANVPLLSCPHALSVDGSTDAPMTDLTRLSEAASQLGVEPGRLTAALEGARRRDAESATAALACARAVPFDLARFTAATELAGRLGLRVDASAARMLLEKRRRGATLGLLQRAAGADTEAVLGMCVSGCDGGVMGRYGCDWYVCEVVRQVYEALICVDKAVMGADGL